MFESFIFYCLFEDIKDNIDSQQFGFRPGYSTVHYLVALLDSILKKNGACVDALSADIVKASDSLNHNVVVEEAKVMGAHEFAVRMFANVLFKRSQCIQLPYHDPSGFSDSFVVRRTRKCVSKSSNDTQTP